MNFPDIWKGRMIMLLAMAFNQAWAAGIPELVTDPIVLGEGTPSEKNAIHLAELDILPEVYNNNTTYPLSVETFADGTVLLYLDKKETKPTSVSDDDIMGASYDKIDAVTKTHVIALTNDKYRKGLHAMAPSDPSLSTPVLIVTGDPRPGKTRKTCTYEDIVALAEAFDNAECPEDGRRLVLCSDHWSDMLLDRKNFGDHVANYTTGTVLDIAGFKVYKATYAPRYNSIGEGKLPYGTVPDAKEYRASVAFWEGNVAIKTGITKQYFSEASTKPTNPVNELNYRHYFMMLPKQNKWIGALTSIDA